MQTIESLYIFLGILMCVLAIPLILKKIKPNWVYGFRTPATLANTDLWFNINNYFGKWMLATGILFLIVSIVLARIPTITVDMYGLSATVVMLAMLGIGIYLCIQKIHNYGKY